MHAQGSEQVCPQYSDSVTMPDDDIGPVQEAVPVSPGSCQSAHDVMNLELFRCRKEGPLCSSGSDGLVSHVSKEEQVVTSGTEIFSFKRK